TYPQFDHEDPGFAAFEDPKPLPPPQPDPHLASAHQPVLKVIGLGGGGSNAISRMMELSIRGVEFIAANTDIQALNASPAPTKIQLGPVLTRGLGAGGNPSVGLSAAKESYRELAAALAGADMVFLTAGMGGGTGTGAIPVAAEIARSQGAVTIAVVTTPFSFEMGKRGQNATRGLAFLQKHTDTLISIPNDRLLYVAPEDLPIETAFHLADDVLRQAVQGITELITEPGLINVDFAHIRRLMKLGGGALMSIGQGRGEGKVQMAVEQALHHPLLEAISVDSAAGVIANFTGGQDMTLSEVGEALDYLQERTGDGTEVVMGAMHDDGMEGRAQVILVITGLGAPSLEEVLPGAERLLENSEPEAAAHAPTHLQSFNPEPIPELASEAPMPIDPVQPPPPIPTPEQEIDPRTQNLDIPAFMRRRSRYKGYQTQAG
ncbi:MAG: cell division protein FtsZ, partial [Anaerolineales bacterium]|nr:cell division protein FtsZ [Anaerolineales bacterium]